MMNKMLDLFPRSVVLALLVYVSLFTRLLIRSLARNSHEIHTDRLRITYHPKLSLVLVVVNQLIGGLLA